MIKDLEEVLPGYYEDFERFEKLRKESYYCLMEMKNPGFVTTMSMIIEDYCKLHGIDKSELSYDIHRLVDYGTDKV